MKLAGRLIFIRDMGKLWFCRLRDETGEAEARLAFSGAAWRVRPRLRAVGASEDEARL